MRSLLLLQEAKLERAKQRNNEFQDRVLAEEYQQLQRDANARKAHASRLILPVLSFYMYVHVSTMLSNFFRIEHFPRMEDSNQLRRQVQATVKNNTDSVFRAQIII